MSSQLKSKLKFDNRFVNALPVDIEREIFPRQVFNACYSLVNPTAVKAPQRVAYSLEVAEEIGLTVADCESDLFAEVFAGNQLLPGMQPYAMCYGGHQFGYWAGQLGDGRAINLGEVSHRNKRQTLQLKGSGLTPYSRSADGLAVLRSSVREFLCSEAMHHLGIPTTRALSIILTGESVARDMFYDGHPQLEPGAVVCRVSPSFIRFGSFQILTSRKEFDLLKQLADFTIQEHFSHLLDGQNESSLSLYARWFEEVCLKTAELITHWQRVGFVHGVMNTDNMSILGETIDYGPYGWLDAYDPQWTPNTTDAEHRRYRYSQQPEIALWNLNQLANALYPLFNDEKPLQQGLDLYCKAFNQGWHEMMGQKLGFRALSSPEIVTDLLSLLPEAEVDMTLFYRQLADINIEKPLAQFDNPQCLAPLSSAWYHFDALSADYKQRFSNWLRAYVQQLQQTGMSQADKSALMNSVNPKYILRNYLSQQAIDLAEQGDFSMVTELLDVVRKPYAEQPDKEDRFAQKRPDWARSKAGCSMLSCSS